MIEWSYTSFGEEMDKIIRVENEVFICFDVHKFGMSICRVLLWNTL